MIKALNHVAIVVPDLDSAAARYRDLLGARISDRMVMAQDGIAIVFIQLDNTKIELVQPIAPHPVLDAFLENNPEGGIHHVCFEVDSVDAARERLSAQGCASSAPQIGSHGKLITFLERKDFNGAVIELEDA